MAESMIYDYYYGDESSQFSFYRIPRQLVTGQQFKKISTDAKLLYGLLLDRMGLSARRRWGLGSDRASKARARQTNEKSMSNAETPKPPKIGSKKSENQKSRVPIIRSQDFRFSEVQTSENQTVIILNLIKLILAIKINLSIHRLPPSSRDGWIEASI
ncbi:MAG: replication initiator protein A [Dysosmobacter sp.]